MVNCLGKQLLARAALAGDEDREAVGCGLQGLLLEGEDDIADPDDALEGVAGRADIDELLFIEANL
ncbi:MAG: hypothetical protein ACK5PS_19725 [Desulfopila sp.]